MIELESKIMMHNDPQRHFLRAKMSNNNSSILGKISEEEKRRIYAESPASSKKSLYAHGKSTERLNTSPFNTKSPNKDLEMRRVHTAMNSQQMDKQGRNLDGTQYFEQTKGFSNHQIDTVEEVNYMKYDTHRDIKGAVDLH